MLGHLQRPPRKEYRYSYIPPLSSPPQPNDYYYFRPYNYVQIANHQADAAFWGGGAYQPYSNDIFQRIYQEFDAESIPLPAESTDGNSDPLNPMPNAPAESNNPFEAETSSDDFEASNRHLPAPRDDKKPGVLEILKNLKPLSGEQTSSRRSYLQAKKND